MEDMHGQDWLCTQCANAFVYMPKPDYRLPGQSITLGYCHWCKEDYYAEHREQIHLAYQDYLDLFPTPGYVYGLLDPRDREIFYIGRASNMDRRIREHRRDDSGKTPKSARIRDLHEQMLTFEYCVLSTVTPGYYVVEMEARWLCQALRQGYPLTNKEAYEDYFAPEKKQRMLSSPLDFFTCPDYMLAYGDLRQMMVIKDYVRWVNDMPVEFPPYLGGWFQEWPGSISQPVVRP
jgi:GIY-YIG catalytic domain